MVTTTTTAAAAAASGGEGREGESYVIQFVHGYIE